MPLALSYLASNGSRSSRIKRAVFAAAVSSVLGGLFAAVSLVVLHPRPIEVLPAAPVVLVCLLRGGGDWDAIIFIWVGGFILYGIYGFVTTFPSATRRRVAVGVVCAAIHLCAALLCEMSRRGQL